MLADTWTVIDGGEELRGPLRALDTRSPTEPNFVRSSWLKSMAHKPSESRYALMQDVLGHAQDEHGHPHKLVRDALLETCAVRVAVASDAPGATILGWACVEPPKAGSAGVVHYVYVAQPFRRRGLARQMLADFDRQAEVLCSHWTYAGDAARPKRWRRSVYRAIQKVAEHAAKRGGW